MFPYNTNENWYLKRNTAHLCINFNLYAVTDTPIQYLFRSIIGQIFFKFITFPIYFIFDFKGTYNGSKLFIPSITFFAVNL